MSLALQDNRQPAAVVIGLDCVTGLQTARILAQRSIPVIGLAGDPKHPCSRTNVCARILFANTASEEFIFTLEKLGPELSQKAVLFPCTDLSVLLISQQRERLESWYHVVLPSRDVVHMLIDKISFYDYAQKNALPIPATFVLRDRADAERVARDLAFPCVLKPPIKTPSWEKHLVKKAFMAANAEEFLALYDRCSQWAPMLVVQEWAPGTDADLYTCNSYFNAESLPLVTFTTRKIRQWPPKIGVACLAEECRNEVVQKEAIRLFQATHHRGLAYLEMKRDPRTGKHLIIEPNIGRPTGRSAMAEAAGVELLYTQYCDALGWPLPSNREQKYQGVKWVHFRRDLQSASLAWWNDELTVSEWARSWRGPKTDALFSWRDPVPFLLDWKMALGKLVKNRTQPRNDHLPEALPELVAGGNRGDAARRPKLAVGNGTGQHFIDYDIHGLIGIRLINPSPGDAAVVARQLGSLRSPLTGPPDIIVRFVESLPTPNFRYVELGKNGFTDDGFFILCKGTPTAKVRIAFDQIGECCEIVCESGLGSVPLLRAILSLTALKKGCVALHASAFVYKGAGVLVTGFAHGGKTGALLAFAAHGARYIGDECILLSDDGRKMYGVPENVQLKAWHLENLPHLRRSVSFSDRLKFRAIRGLGRPRQGTPTNTFRGWWPLGLLRQPMPALRRRLSVQLDPQTIFGAAAGPFEAGLEKVFFLVNHEDPRVRVEPEDPLQIAPRMMASVRYEFLPLLSHYLAHQFAFPGKKNDLIERAHELQYGILRRALAGKEAYVVSHPYQCSFQELFEGMRPFCDPACAWTRFDGLTVTLQSSLKGAQPRRLSTWPRSR